MSNLRIIKPDTNHVLECVENLVERCKDGDVLEIHGIALMKDGKYETFRTSSECHYTTIGKLMAVIRDLQINAERD